MTILGAMVCIVIISNRTSLYIPREMMSYILVKFQRDKYRVERVCTPSGVFIVLICEFVFRYFRIFLYASLCRGIQPGSAVLASPVFDNCH